MPIKDIAKELALLLLLAVITAFVVNFYSSKGIALTGDWDTAQGVITAKAKDNVVNHGLEIQDIRIAKEIYDGKEAIFVDARAYEDYKDGHIKGAVSMPINQLEERIVKFIANYPADTYIITYCSGRECDDSHELAQLLFEEGYTTISVFIDGYPAWEGKGYPIESVKH
jgi:rhodanese-related sulfurtransferase